MSPFQKEHRIERLPSMLEFFGCVTDRLMNSLIHNHHAPELSHLSVRV
jgi:hypothetical protein